MLLLAALLHLLSVTHATEIIIPSAGTVYVPGEKVTIKVKKTVNQPFTRTIAFSVGCTVYNQSLGRPFITSIFTAKPGAWKWNPEDSTYTFDVQIPAASSFIDGYTRQYSLAISEFYLDGDYRTPKLGFASIPVSIYHN